MKRIFLVIIILFFTVNVFSSQIYTFKSSAEILTVDHRDSNIFIFLDDGTLWLIDVKTLTSSIIDIGGPVFFKTFQYKDSIFFITSPGSIIKGAQVHHYKYHDVFIKELSLVNKQIKKSKIDAKKIHTFKMNYPYFFMTLSKKFIIYNYNTKKINSEYKTPIGGYFYKNKLIVLIRETDLIGYYKIFIFKFGKTIEKKQLSYQILNAEIINYNSKDAILTKDGGYSLFDAKSETLKKLIIPKNSKYLSANSNELIFSNTKDFILYKDGKIKKIGMKEFPNLNSFDHLIILNSENNIFSFYSYNENYFNLYIYNKDIDKLLYNDKFLIRSLAKPNVWIYPKNNKIHIIYQDILRTITINDESVDVKNKKITWGISKVKFTDNYAILSDSKIIYIYSLID